MNNLYKSEKISKETKDKIYNRILELSKNNAIVTKMVEGLKRDNTLDKAINKANAEKYKLYKWSIENLDWNASGFIPFFSNHCIDNIKLTVFTGDFSPIEPKVIA